MNNHLDKKMRKDWKCINVINLIDSTCSYINKEGYKYKRIQFLKNKLETYNSLPKDILLEIQFWYYTATKQNIPQELINDLLKVYKNKEFYPQINLLNALLEKSYTIKDIVYDSVNLSNSQIKTYVMKKNEFKYWIKLRENNPNLYCCVMLCGILIGHIGGIYINKSQYELLYNGTLNELEINTKKLEKSQYLYIPTIVIDNKFRGISILKKLLKCFFLQISKYPCITHLIAIAYTIEGEQLLKGLDFQYINDHQESGKVFELILQQKNFEKYNKLFS